MALIDRVKERIESDLSDEELQAMIDSLLAEIDQRYGPSSDLMTTDLFSELRDRKYLRLPRRVESVDSIIEREAEEDKILSANDYRISHRGRLIERLSKGDNPAQAWAPKVRITFTPVSDVAPREEVVIQLVQLQVNNPGLTSETKGDWSASYSDVDQRRGRILASLDARNTGFNLA